MKSFLIREVVLKLIAIKGGNWVRGIDTSSIVSIPVSIPEIKEFLPSLLERQ
jgi:hypothetical protein